MDNIQTVKALENLRFESLIAKDYTTFQNLCDENLTYIHSSGKQDNLFSYVEKLNNSFYVFQNVNYDIKNIVEFNDTVLVFADLEANLLVQEQPTLLVNRTLSVWKKTLEGLKLFAYQPTPIK